MSSKRGLPRLRTAAVRRLNSGLAAGLFAAGAASAAAPAEAAFAPSPDVTAVALDASGIRIGWKVRTESREPLRVWRSQMPDGEWQWVGDTTIDMGWFDDGGLVAGTGYRYALQFLNSSGRYAWTDGPAISTPPGRGIYHGRLAAEARGQSLTNGSIVRLENGELLLIHNRHMDLRDGQIAGQMIVSRRSADNGRNWSEERLLFKSEIHALGKVCLERLGDGALGLVAVEFKVTPPPPGLGNKTNIGVAPRGARLLFHRSEDGGETWSAPVDMLATAGINHPYVSCRTDGLVRAARGRLLLPAFAKAEGPGFEYERRSPFQTFMLVSDDHGRTWQRTWSFDNGRYGSWEGSAAPHGEGGVFLVVRNLDGWYYGANSFDNGGTWTGLRRLNVRGWHSPPMVVAIPGTAALLLVYHAKWPALDHGDRREILAGQVSFDGGHTFQGYTEIEYWGTEYRSFQNHGVEIDRGEVFVYYSTSADRDGHGEGRIAILPVETFLARARGPGPEERTR